jgi:hypothetical protein
MKNWYFTKKYTDHKTINSNNYAKFEVNWPRGSQVRARHVKRMDRQKCYGPDKKILFKKTIIWPWGQTSRPTKVIMVCDTPPYGHAPTYQISLTYLERQKSYGPDKLRWEKAEEKIRLKQYVSLRSKGRHNYRSEQSFTGLGSEDLCSSYIREDSPPHTDTTLQDQTLLTLIESIKVGYISFTLSIN